MTRNRATAKADGSRWETAIVEFLHERGIRGAFRRARSGAKDKGDVSMGHDWPVTIEAKDVRAKALAEWVAEANVEAENAGVSVGVVWWKRIGKTSPGAGYVIMDGEAFVRLMKGDDD